MQYFFDKVLRVFLRICLGDSQQHKQARSDSSGDLSIHFDARLFYPLDHDSHG